MTNVNKPNKMKQSVTIALVAQFLGLAAAGTTEWSGSFNDLTVTSLEDWSWSNQVGEYQWYIYGTGNTTDYVDFSSSYANPDDSTSTQGAKITLTDTSYWEGQTMRRTELIPQASDTSAISSGTLYYHFSIMREDTNAPSVQREHQIAFFESHFTELQYGLATGSSGEGDTSLKWMANSAEQWNVTMDAGVWHNCVYEIDFDAGTVGFWHSTGGDALTQVVSPVTASASSNGADWHVGVLELAATGVSDATEDFYFSGVYIESGDLTTTFSGSSSSGSSSAAASSAVVATSAASSAATSSSSEAAAATSSSSSSVEVATSAAAAAATTSSAAATSAAATSAAAATSSAAATSAAPATTLAVSSAASCTRTKTVYVTQSA